MGPPMKASKDMVHARGFLGNMEQVERREKKWALMGLRGTGTRWLRNEG